MKGSFWATALISASVAAAGLIPSWFLASTKTAASTAAPTQVIGPRLHNEQDGEDGWVTASFTWPEASPSPTASASLQERQVATATSVTESYSQHMIWPAWQNDSELFWRPGKGRYDTPTVFECRAKGYDPTITWDPVWKCFTNHTMNTKGLAASSSVERWDCDRYSLYTDRYDWREARDCWNLCKPCLQWAVNSSMEFGDCYTTTFMLAKCWTGFGPHEFKMTPEEISAIEASRTKKTEGAAVPTRSRNVMAPRDLLEETSVHLAASDAPITEQKRQGPVEKAINSFLEWMGQKSAGDLASAPSWTVSLTPEPSAERSAAASSRPSIQLSTISSSLGELVPSGVPSHDLSERSVARIQKRSPETCHSGGYSPELHLDDIKLFFNKTATHDHTGQYRAAGTDLYIWLSGWSSVDDCVSACGLCIEWAGANQRDSMDCIVNSTTKFSKCQLGWQPTEYAPGVATFPSTGTHGGYQLNTRMTWSRWPAPWTTTPVSYLVTATMMQPPNPTGTLLLVDYTRYFLENDMGAFPSMAEKNATPGFDVSCTGYLKSEWSGVPLPTPIYLPDRTATHGYWEWVNKELDFGTLQNIPPSTAKNKTASATGGNATLNVPPGTARPDIPTVSINPRKSTKSPAVPSSSTAHASTASLHHRADVAAQVLDQNAEIEIQYPAGCKESCEKCVIWAGRENRDRAECNVLAYPGLGNGPETVHCLINYTLAVANPVGIFVTTEETTHPTHSPQRRAATAAAPELTPEEMKQLKEDMKKNAPEMEQEKETLVPLSAQRVDSPARAPDATTTLYIPGYTPLAERPSLRRKFEYGFMRGVGEFKIADGPPRRPTEETEGGWRSWGKWLHDLLMA